jgi:peptidyl-prolyl cis-trans isomerase B (cyclophilin B)
MKKIFTSFAMISLLVFSWCLSDEQWEKIWKQNLKNNKNNMEINQTNPPIKWDFIAIFDTNFWKMKFKLFPKETPKTFENLKWLSDKKYYDWLIFHRIIPNFMIQGWDTQWTWMWWESFWGGKFDDEPHKDLKNIKWALSMANSWPNTNGSQFFIVQAEATPWLDGYQNWKKTCGTFWTSCHTVFWQIFEWENVLDKIAWVKTGRWDKPVKDVVLKSVRVEKLK